MKQPTLTTTKNTTLSTRFTSFFSLDRGIEAVILLAIGATPLLFTNASSELFEFPKMVFIYALAIIGLVLIAYKIHRDKQLVLVSTPIHTPLLLFILIFTISTILSIDIYTSIMGYYSRFNGGFASLAAYLVLFYLTLIHLSPNKSKESNIVGSKKSKDPTGSRREKGGGRREVGSGFSLKSFLAKVKLFNTDNGKRTTNNILQSTPVSHKIQRILWTWLTSSLLVSLWGIFEHFGYDFSCLLLTGNIEATCWVQDVQARVFASFGQPNWLAAYLLSSIPIALYLLISSNSQRTHLIAWIIALCNYAAFWYTYSRSGWIGLITTLVLFTPFLFHPQIKKRLPWLINLIIACAIISLTSLSMATQRTATSLDSGEFDSSTGQIRILVWEGSLKTIAEYPLFGSGPETFPYSFLPHRPSDLNTTTEWNFLYNKAHNDLLQVAATLGLIGAAVWLWLYSRIGSTTWQQFRSAKPNFLGVALFSGIIGVFVAQLFGFSVVVTSLLFWISAAIIASGSSWLSQKQLSATQSNAIILTSLIITLVLSFGLIRYTAAEVLTNKASQNSDLPSLSILELEQAIKLNPLESKYHAQQARNYAQLAQWTPDAEPYIQSSLNHARQAFQLNPHNMINLKSLLFTYQLLAKVESTYNSQFIDLAQHALTLDKNDVVIHQYLAKAYAENDDTQKALDQYNKIINLRPHAADSYQLRAEFYLATNQPQKAQKDLQTALDLEPDNEEIQETINEIKAEG